MVVNFCEGINQGKSNHWFKVFSLPQTNTTPELFSLPQTNHNSRIIFIATSKSQLQNYFHCHKQITTPELFYLPQTNHNSGTRDRFQTVIVR